MTASVLHSIVDRTPLAADGKSGSVLERARLADGTRLVLKRVEPHGDWIMRATGDTERAHTLYALGILERVPRAIDHAVDFAWYLAINASRISATKDEIIDDLREISGPAHDDVALELALMGALAQLGWDKAIGATEHSDEAARAWEKEDMEWWFTRTREALESWSPL